MKNNWFDIFCWVTLTVAALYTTLYATYVMLEVLLK